jgi:hypothetical protein
MASAQTPSNNDPDCVLHALAINRPPLPAWSKSWSDVAIKTLPDDRAVYVRAN